MSAFRGDGHRFAYWLVRACQAAAVRVDDEAVVGGLPGFALARLLDLPFREVFEPV